jgi:cytidine deaminase
MRKLPLNKNKRKILIDFYINRSNKNGGCKPAMPCTVCLKHMSRLHLRGYIVKNVFYVNNDRIIIKQKLEDMLNSKDQFMSTRFKYNIRKK